MKYLYSTILALSGISMILVVGCRKAGEPVLQPSPKSDYGSFTDPRDGITYKTIEYGALTWFAENLNYDTAGSWCYNDDPAIADEYGRLYSWKTALKVCPYGWHLPGQDEWSVLIDYKLDNMSVAGAKLKETDTIHWNSPNKGATDEIHFTALPGGYYSYYQSYERLGEIATFWSIEENDNLTAYKYDLFHDYEHILYDYDLKLTGKSVRCVKDK